MPQVPQEFWSRFETAWNQRKPYLMLGKIGENYRPSQEEQKAGEQASFALPFCCTFGIPRLVKSPQAPEIFIWSWPEMMEVLLEGVYNAIHHWKGTPWPLDTPLDGWIEDRRIMLRQVHPDNQQGLVPELGMMYGLLEQPTPAMLQMIIPDNQGKFPGEEGCDKYLDYVQPSLKDPWQKVPAQLAAASSTPVVSDGVVDPLA